MTELDKQNFPDPSSFQNLNSWLNSMSSLLGEVSRVEISTMIVDEITEDVFLPYEVYQAIYEISPSYLEELKIDSSLRDRYLRLRRQLELQYALLLTDKNSSLYDEELTAEVTRDLPLLAQETTTWEKLPCRLPPLIDYGSLAANKVLYRLLAEPQFQTILRQVGEIKASLDRRNMQLARSREKNLALTYIQTLIQLDGKIVNRYASAIINHPQQKEIIELHKTGIELGEEQWRKLLRFVTEMVRRQQKFQQSSNVK